VLALRRIPAPCPPPCDACLVLETHYWHIAGVERTREPWSTKSSFFGGGGGFCPDAILLQVVDEAAFSAVCSGCAVDGMGNGSNCNWWRHVFAFGFIFDARASFHVEIDAMVGGLQCSTLGGNSPVVRWLLHVLDIVSFLFSFAPTQRLSYVLSHQSKPLV